MLEFDRKNTTVLFKLYFKVEIIRLVIEREREKEREKRTPNKDSLVPRHLDAPFVS